MATILWSVLLLSFVFRLSFVFLSYPVPCHLLSNNFDVNYFDCVQRDVEGKTFALVSSSQSYERINVMN